MRTLSPTLEAAQKKARRLPYVEAEVYDYEAGIKRLSWTRLYEGVEPDNHHGIAIDGQGDMHRIRVEGTNLYYQKQECPFEVPPTFPLVFPFPLVDPPPLDQWTQLAADCAGPCAIAASGAKVYIFYRKTDNTLRKLYSHNYGENWNNAQLAVYADVLSMAACWWAAGNIVVCFAFKYNELNGIVLDTSDQSSSQHIKEFHGVATHIFQDSYGIGATYSPTWLAIEIVLAAKEYDAITETVTYSLYATQFTNTYHFMALRTLLTAHEDVLTLFKYPDCHRPTTPYDYETLQLTVVEAFSGVTAYSRPLSAHLVKGTDWSSGTITEPRPFVDISSAYGLRLQSTDGYWWLSMPGGLWRAPRTAAAPIDLTPYIQQFQQVISPDRPGWLNLELDNSKGHFASLGEGALASLHFRSEVALRLGYRTPAGDETVESLTYWVDSWEYSTTQQTQSTLKLRCLDLRGLAEAWSARYSLRWNYTAVDPCRVWEILYQLLGRFGIRLWNNPAAPKSTAIDNYYPKFLARGGSHANTQLRRLLSFVTDGLVPRESLCFTKDLLPDESPSYEYKNQPGAHRISQGAYGEATPITHVQVSGDTQDEPPVRVRESAFAWDLLALGIDNLRMQYDPNLEEADQAEKRADALSRQAAQEAAPAAIIVPTNVGQELLDVVTVTDARVGLTGSAFRVLRIQTDYDRRKALYEQRLTLGAP